MGEKCVFVDVVDEDVVEFGVEFEEDVIDEIVGEWMVFFYVVDCYLDGVVDGMIDVDDEGFVFVVEKYGVVVGCGYYVFDGNFDDIFLYG